MHSFLNSSFLFPTLYLFSHLIPRNDLCLFIKVIFASTCDIRNIFLLDIFASTCDIRNIFFSGHFCLHFHCLGNIGTKWIWLTGIRSRGQMYKIKHFSLTVKENLPIFCLLSWCLLKSFICYQ